MKIEFASYKRASKEVKLASSNSGIFDCIHFHTKALIDLFILHLNQLSVKFQDRPDFIDINHCKR